MSLSEPVKSQISELVQQNAVVLFMKGTRQFPQCGFSSQVIQILDRLGAPYTTVNVLTDPAVRDGIKEFSSWPTIPQLYVKGEFVGGCDIVKEMMADGSLRKLVGVADAPPPAKLPTVRLTDGAAAAIKAAVDEGSNDVLRLEIDGRFQYGLSFGPKEADDVEVVANGITIVMDRATAGRADDTSIHFVEGSGGGFKLTNPNEPTRVKQLTAPELKAMIDRGEAVVVYDVRTDAERALAKLPFAKLLDDAARAALEDLDKGTQLVFHCHHGGRSQAAAEHFVQKGFKNVHNLRGGIDAWSQAVDSSVPRY